MITLAAISRRSEWWNGKVYADDMSLRRRLHLQPIDPDRHRREMTWSSHGGTLLGAVFLLAGLLVILAAIT